MLAVPCGLCCANGMGLKESSKRKEVRNFLMVCKGSWYKCQFIQKKIRNGDHQPELFQWQKRAPVNKKSPVLRGRAAIVGVLMFILPLPISPNCGAGLRCSRASQRYGKKAAEVVLRKEAAQTPLPSQGFR